MKKVITSLKFVALLTALSGGVLGCGGGGGTGGSVAVPQGGISLAPASAPVSTGQTSQAEQSGGSGNGAGGQAMQVLSAPVMLPAPAAQTSPSVVVAEPVVVQPAFPAVEPVFSVGPAEPEIGQPVLTPVVGPEEPQFVPAEPQPEVTGPVFTIGPAEPSVEVANQANEDMTPVMPLGLQFDPDYEDLPLAAGEEDGAGLPRSVDLSAFFPYPPLSQGNSGSCVGFAVANVKTYQERLQYGWTDTSATHQMSPAFIYNQIKLPGSCQAGTYLSLGLDLITSAGVSSLAAMPYSERDCTSQPNDSAKDDARRFKAKGYSRVRVSEMSLKAELAKGQPLAISIRVSNRFERLGHEEIYAPTSKERFYKDQGHALVMVGYDDERLAFKVLNSWSTRWGTNGYGWVAYSALGVMVKEAYVVQDADLPSLPTPQPATSGNPLDYQYRFAGRSGDLGLAPGQEGCVDVHLLNEGKSAWAIPQNGQWPRGTFNLEVTREMEAYRHPSWRYDESKGTYRVGFLTNSGELVRPGEVGHFRGCVVAPNPMPVAKKFLYNVVVEGVGRNKKIKGNTYDLFVMINAVL